MKKHLIAAAVAGALAVPAMAQVTVYGRLDVSHSSRTVKETSGEKRKSAAVVYSAHSTSRFGLKGTEDLGGGLKANFLIETQLGEDTGDALQGDGPVDNEAFGGRGMWAGISGGFGEIRLGTQNQFAKDNSGKYSSSGGSNVLGDPTLGSGRAIADVAKGTALDQRYQQIQYLSPKMSGFQVKGALISQKQDADDTVAGTADQTGYEVALEYNAGPLSVAAVFGELDTNGTSANANTLRTTPANSTTEFSLKTTLIGASYDLGIAKLFYKHGKVDMSQSGGNATTDGDASYNVLGVSSKLGSVNVFANFADGEYETIAGTTSFDDGGYQVGATYSLSKRTYLYGIYGMAETDITATTKQKDTQMALGVVHSF